ncbi:ATP-binding protein [Flavobacterium antarcticum]|uniref:sensor histidine kinase n=1 Tax=Flavobacterium antarcticum TaxID=271155 RepID=UPI0003B48FF0|nr:ATP-binding protein [Flavobacterium antarcticum]
MRFQKILYTWLATFCFFTVAIAQTQNRINWTADSDLLPQNSVKSIIPDKYGYIWLSTENGLVRFDGLNYKIYNSKNLRSKSNRILFIQGNAASDTLFAGTDVIGELILIHNRTAVKIDPTTVKNAAVYINELKNSYNSFGTSPYKIELRNMSYRILLNSKRYYLITEKMVQYYSSTNELLSEVPFEHSNSNYFFTIGEKLFYLENKKQFAVFDEGKIEWHTPQFELASNFKILWNKGSEQVFLQSNSKLFQITSKENKLNSKLLLTDNQLPFANLNSAYYDKVRSIIFLGSSTNGLGIYRIRSFKTQTIVDDKQSAVFYAMHPLTDSTIITSSGVVMSKDTILHQYNFTNKERTAMAMDAANNIWLKSSAELYQYTKATGYTVRKTYGFKERIGTIFLDNSNKIWITFENNYRTTSKLLSFTPSEHPVFKNSINLNFYINYIKQRDDGTLWIAGSKGLYLFNPKTYSLKRIDGTSKLNIRSVLETEKEEVWIATYESGFYLHKNNTLHHFPLDKKQYLSTTHYFIADGKGYFWITTNKGLFQVKKEALLAYIKNPKRGIYYHYYSKNSGFLTNEFNGGGSPYAAKLGTQLFLPSMNGVATFDTEKIVPLEPKNPIYIDRIDVDNKEVSLNIPLKLPKDYKRVTFSFSSPYYGNELNSNYEVMLEGPTNLEWTTLNAEQEYSLMKLPPGNYTLTARKLAGFDSDYIYKKINLSIEPTFYETNWFVVLIALVIMLLAYCFSKIYSNNVRHRNKILIQKIKEKTKDLQNTISTLRATKDNMKRQADKNNKLIQIISHDIKSPLKFMSMASKYMYDDFDPNSPDLKENILSIHTSSSQIYNFLDNILSYSKVNNEDGALANERFLLFNEIYDKIELFKNIATSQKTKVINAIPQTLQLNTNKSLFAIIIHNLLDNALKHTVTGKVTFSAEQKEDDFFITIADEGTGMDSETLTYYQSVISDFDGHENRSKRKLGLHLVIELMLILNGKIELISQESKGTTVILQFSNQTEKESS